MKILILGGTRFLGRHLVTAALARNHEVTLFNRGQHQSVGLAEVETIHGDRNQDLVKLHGGHWDAVIDTCGMLPHSVKTSAEFLSSSVDHYTFISSQSVYSDVGRLGVDEQAPLKTLTNEQIEEANAIDPSSAAGYGQLYGGLKALCEQALVDAMPDRALNIRPGLIVGPFDYTDRFTYWVVRVARGGEVLAPGRPERVVQFIDARDLAEWIVKMIEGKKIGVYNANGTPGSMTMNDVLAESKAVTHSDASFTWVAEPFLFQEGVAAWSEMPLWLPEENAPQLKGFMFVNCEKAIKDGLRFRSLRETIKDTYDWQQSENASKKLVAGMDPEKEKTLLSKWQLQ